MNRTNNAPISMAENDAMALAAEMFDHFSAATTMRQILGLYRNMCDTIGLRAGPLNEFYPKLKSKIKTWKAQALWKKFDARASHRVYNKGTACKGTRVLVIGAGPCGLRTAIEAQLLGAKVVVVEKRDRISRNNVLHLWPFLITDLRNLGAKKFYGKFCAGSIDHISIRQLQCILLKVALLLGVEVHEGISFEKVIEPTDGCGWRAKMSPDDHAVSHYEFDVLIGADGKRNTLDGFRRKEFRGKLAIAITANFINKKTEAEAKAEEISGVAFIFNQSFFKELYSTTGIDLENIVYYKDDTHYFVMTAKKHSLIDKGVIMQDFADPAELLSSGNVNTERLLDYAREAAQFSTKYQMPNLEFAVNHYGKPDVAMFDFTSMFAAEISCSAIVRKNYRLLQCLVGDSLLEPFWPTGSGCARGFLSSMDAAYAMKLWNNQRNSVLAVLAQRESIYRLLAQTTPENLHRDIGSYTLDPATRYPNLNRAAVSVHQVKHLLNTDDPAVLEQTFMDSNALTAAPELPTRRKRRTGDTLPLSTVLLRWIRAQLQSHEFAQSLDEVSECFTNGQVLCALINRYRPDLVDLTKLKGRNVMECNDLAFTIIENELMIPRVMTALESLTLENVDSKMWLTYLEQICEVFRGEIPHVKHPKLEFAELKDKPNSRIPDFSRLLKMNTHSKVKSPSREVEMVNVSARGATTAANELHRIRKFTHETTPVLPLDAPSRRAKKRRSHEKFGNLEERQRRNQEIEENRQDRQNKRRLQRAQQTQNFYKSLHMLQANTLLRESDSSSPFEDYSIFMYRQSAPEFGDRVKELERKLMYPDRDRGIASAMPRNTEFDYQFNDRIKSMEHKITAKNIAITEKKPKDLLRAIGKIESNDWNIREIEKKIELSKKTEVGKSREKVPKWSKEQFLQRQNKMARPLERQGSVDEKFKEIDATIKNFDKQMKDGAILERGQRGKNKVASIAGSFGKKEEDKLQQEDKSSLQRSNSKAGAVFAGQTVSEMCHFCKQKVYLMEKISAEGLILHRACLKCHHCHTSLRLGGYAFDRDDPAGRFYCTQHYRLPAKVQRPIPKRSIQRIRAKTETDAHHNLHHQAAKSSLHANAKETPAETVTRDRREGIANLDLLNRGQTPERIEFENTDAMSDGEPSLENIIDENEWTDRNFGTGTEDSESDITSTDSSESGSDEEYEEAMGSPLGAQTLQLATDWIGKQRYSANQYSDEDDDDEFYDSSEDEGADSQTEGEEMDRARQIRMQEVKLKPLPYLPTDTETEVQSDTDSSSPVVELNSATEISTDSEFEQDPITTDNSHLKKPTRVQIKQSVIENGFKRTSPTKPIAPQPLHQQCYPDIHIEFKPLVQVDPSVLTSNRMPLKNPRPGDYMLNKTSSTEGIASKKSLELKKRYLLGETGLPGGIIKSDSTSVLDSKFKNFHSNISQCQKLLSNATPAAASLNVVSTDMKPVMQNFLRNSPTNPVPLETSASITAPTIAVPSKEQLSTNNSDEKENVYGKFVNTKNELNKSELTEAPIATSMAPLKILETVNTALVENKLKDLVSPRAGKIYETIDLVTPEKQDVVAMLQIGKFDEIIDLTGDLSEKLKASQKTPTESERNKNTIDSMLKNSELRKSLVHDDDDDVDVDDLKPVPAPRKSPIRDAPPLLLSPPAKIPWSAKSSKISDLESDSLSSSTTSSIADIPHFLMESTTSPDTLPGDRFVPQPPRLVIGDTVGELMQIDSLMIVDGKYVGDPEDLKHMQMPEAKQREQAIVEPLQQQRPPEPKRPPPPICDIASPSERNVPNAIKSTVNYKYEASTTNGKNRKRPDLKFDTRNENKIDTLKNLPLIMSDTEAKPQKPTQLLLLHPTATEKPAEQLDTDKTPTAGTFAEMTRSDSETELTNPALTETELSDWAADDAVSENFVDIEFALNSNKGTIRRNKKSKKKSHAALAGGRPASATASEHGRMCPIATKDLDFDGIEFMDTGSEDSCLETYSATNKAMLKNRGYVQFVDHQQLMVGHHVSGSAGGHPIQASSNKEMYSYKSDAGYGSSPKDSFDKNYKPSALDLHEAVNKEVPGVDYIEQGACILGNDIDLKTPMNEVPPMFAVKRLMTTGEQPDSLLDIEEDSLVMFPSHGNTTTTTETSEALTVVTSPLDSTPNLMISSTTASSTTTTSSPPKDDEVSQNRSASLVSSELPVAVDEKRHKEMAPINSTDDCTYEDYVRKLQLKISQISNARDSIDVRKTKRKYSKGELSSVGGSFDGNGLASGIQLQQSNSVIDVNKSLSIFVNKPEEPPTVGERIEEITKERTKQKDLIHDLVMDKLQSKKLLNAEKRLNRSRNRSSMFSPTADGSGRMAIVVGANIATTPVGAPLALTTSASCSNVPHFHAVPVEHHNNNNNNISPLKVTLPKYSPFFGTSSVKSKEPRPLSDNMTIAAATTSPQKLMKTQSFCVYTSREPPLLFAAEQVNGFSTPIPPPRRKYEDTPQVTQTEKLRQDARARARLKSNQDLGLSPDEKIQLLRKRFNLDHLPNNGAAAVEVDAVQLAINKSDDMKVRERKMIASKSVNDITSVAAAATTTNRSGHLRPLSSDGFGGIGGGESNKTKHSDFTSDPNLADGTPTAQKRRAHNKDPDRRKSIIKAVSDFFYKKKDVSPSGKASSESVFGRFRISPKSKSKDKDDAPVSCERSKSEDPLKVDDTVDVHHSRVRSSHQHHRLSDDVMPPPIPPLPTNYQRSDDESCSANESREQKKLRAHSKASRQAELKRLRIAQEIQREQEEIEVKLKDLEARGVFIEKALRGEGQTFEEVDATSSMGATDDKLLKELLEIWRNITHLKKRDDELGIRQQELKLEHRHAQLKDQLNTRLSCSRLDKSSSDVAAEGAILNEMLEIVAKRAALRSFDTNPVASTTIATGTPAAGGTSSSLVQREPFESDI